MVAVFAMSVGPKADVLKASPDVRFWAWCGHRKLFALVRAITPDDDNRASITARTGDR